MNPSLQKDNEILHGKIWKALLLFFFPILIGTLFQQLYNTVDALVVGRFAGKTALSSVGGSSAILINLVVGFFTGLSSGCTVIISQYFGADDKKNLDRALHTSYAFGITGGIILGILGVLLAPSLLRLMNTPAELMPESTTYIRIYFAGLIFVFIYNMGAAVLRAIGDSKRPLYFLIICTLINIVFDLIFVVIFQLGVLGVALATLLAQAISALLVTICLMRHTQGLVLSLRKIRFHRDCLTKMLSIGLPAAIQSSSYALSNMFIQSAINSFGVDTVAGWTAEGKVDVIFWMINGSFGTAAATFVGQNYGAKQMDRVRRGTITCLLMSLTCAIAISLFLYTLGQNILWLFTTEAVVVEIGQHMIQLIVPSYFVFVFIEIFSSSLRAQGKAVVPTAINLTCIVLFRILWISFLGHLGNLDLIIYCYPASWIFCAICMTSYYLFETHRKH